MYCPTKLLEMCIRLHGVDKVNIVLDPFIGVGSTALACIELGVNFLGFEIDKKYVNIGNERIKEEFDKLGKEEGAVV